MPHATPLITTIVAGLGLAFILGALANRLRLPPLVGYLVAGVIVGPHTPGFVADQHLAPELAEIGVILLMFGVGLHFSLKDLLSVRAIAIPGAIVQIGFATLLGWGLALALGWSSAGGLVFGLSLSVASTVVLLKALQERRLVETERGKIAVGWLIVEDLAMVLTLVLIPAAASIAGGATEMRDPAVAVLGRMLGFDPGIAGIIGMTLLKVVAFVVLMLVVGRRVIPWVLERIAHTGSRELFRLGVLAIALGVAFGAARLFGVSFALGAFFAGMILSESELSHRAAEESLPLRDAFAVLFFVSVGMMFDPTILVRDPLPVLATVAIIVIGKSLAAFAIVMAFGRTAGTALTISASLAQIGEFSFILAELGVGLNLLPEAGRDLILAGAIVSIILNPLVFFVCGQIRTVLEARAEAAVHPAEAAAAAPGAAGAEVVTAPAPAGEEGLLAEPKPVATSVVRAPEEPALLPTGLADHVVLVGYGRIGALIAGKLTAAGMPFLVIEDADIRVEALRRNAIETVVGNAAMGDVLALANLAGARAVLIAIPDVFSAGQVARQARAANADIPIIGVGQSNAEADRLTKLGADAVVMAESAVARGMVRTLERLLEDRPADPGTATPAEPSAAAAPATEGGPADPADRVPTDASAGQVAVAAADPDPAPGAPAPSAGPVPADPR